MRATAAQARPAQLFACAPTSYERSQVFELIWGAGHAESRTSDAGGARVSYEQYSPDKPDCLIADNMFV